ncbi:MAG: hypothetical protein M0Z95_19015 [Actinomycetota bacterium]|jgi:hypothetical protein|nr:hypothetical protein [Actinomycetota bacterium]
MERHNDLDALSRFAIAALGHSLAAKTEARPERGTVERTKRAKRNVETVIATGEPLDGRMKWS